MSCWESHVKKKLNWDLIISYCQMRKKTYDSFNNFLPNTNSITEFTVRKMVIRTTQNCIQKYLCHIRRRSTLE